MYVYMMMYTYIDTQAKTYTHFVKIMYKSILNVCFYCVNLVRIKGMYKY